MINKVKSKIHALIFWQTRAGDFVNQLYGLKIFYVYSFKNSKLKSKKNLQAFLTKQYHIVEKGMALSNPRPGFGKAKINLLLDLSEKYLEKYNEDNLIKCIKGCLDEYIRFNIRENQNIDSQYFQRIKSFLHGFSNEQELIGGTKTIYKRDLMKINNFHFEEFVKSRFSVRDFDLEDVNVESIVRAIEVAKYAPSVCNRQAWRAHLFSDKDVMLQLLAIQGGNNGFTNSINKLIIITADVQSFTTLEYNQVFIDGGLFSMNLVLALHNMNIGACCLNTCLPFTSEKKVKKIAGIQKNERLIMMIGIGNLKEEYKVALSRKKQLSEIAVIH